MSNYLKLKYDQLRKNGRLVIRDVVGPFEKDSEVYVELKEDDGGSEDILKECGSREELETHLKSLSTYAKFLRFSEEFLKDMRSRGKRGEESKIKFKEESVEGKKYVVLTLKDACEFMSKKDYLDNWQSELNEEFTFYSFDEWKNALKNVGFKIVENPNEPDNSSRAFTIPWLVKNRFEGKVTLFKKTENTLERLNYPVTNMVLIGEKLA